MAENYTILMGMCFERVFLHQLKRKALTIAPAGWITRVGLSVPTFKNKAVTRGTVSAEGHHQHRVIKSLANSTEISVAKYI